LKRTLTPHSIIHGDACFAYFNKIWGNPGGVLAIGQCGGDGTVDLDEVSTSRVLWFARFSV
jgi:hypothetical protein